MLPELNMGPTRDVHDFVLIKLHVFAEIFLIFLHGGEYEPDLPTDQTMAVESRGVCFSYPRAMELWNGLG